MRGFTLVEIIIATAILALMSSIGLPSLLEILDRHQSSSSVAEFRRILVGARNIALNNRQKVTVCPFNNNQCSNNWQNPITAFVDLNSNQKIDANEVQLITASNERDSGNWITRSGSSNKVLFNEQGHAFGSATTFLYCPTSGNNKHARQLIISFQGRIRSEHYLSSRDTPFASLNGFTCPE